MARNSDSICSFFFKTALINIFLIFNKNIKNFYDLFVIKLEAFEYIVNKF